MRHKNNRHHAETYPYDDGCISCIIYDFDPTHL